MPIIFLTWKNSVLAILLQLSASEVSTRSQSVVFTFRLLLPIVSTCIGDICKLSFRISCLDKKNKTKVIDNNLDPEWNETFTYQLSATLIPSDRLNVEVFDFERIGRNRCARTIVLWYTTLGIEFGYVKCDKCMYTLMKGLV